jgi:hypothetical protein
MPLREIMLDFLVAGVQKAGTTTLYELLDEHPSISMSSPKETHFFDNETLNWKEPCYDELHAALPAGHSGLRGEATPITFYWTPALPRVKQYRADVRLIVIFRDPIDRARSHFTMRTQPDRLQFGNPTERRSFAQAVSPERRASGGWGGEVEGLDRLSSYVERGYYGEQLSRALQLFSREQMLLLDFEDLRTEQAAMLRRVCSFLDLAPRTDTLFRYAHKSDGAAPLLTHQEEERLANEYRDDLQTFVTLSGLDIGRWRTARWLN